MHYYKAPFFHGASPEIFERAHELRKTMTEAERVLWKRLNRHQLKHTFRRQHPVATYIVDFYCHDARLVIELDGDIHLEKDVAEHDAGREYDLRALDLKVLRFKNEEVMNEIEDVMRRISQAITD